MNLRRLDSLFFIYIRVIYNVYYEKIYYLYTEVITMKIVERSDKNKFRFTCKHCGKTLEANEGELQFSDKGVLKYTCPGCKGKQRTIKERKVTVIPVYTEAKNTKQDQKQET